MALSTVSIFKRFTVLTIAALVLFVFWADTVKALPSGALNEQISAEGKEKAKGVVQSDCPDGQSYTKPSPGIGPMPCGANQCRPDGYLYFTSCLTQSDCNQMGGTTDSGNKAGCVDSDGQELFCCRILKNRCYAESTDPNKLFLCTNEQQCKNAQGEVKGKGFGCTGEYNVCCGLPDSPKAPMKIIGEPLLKGTSEDPTGVGGGLAGGSFNKAKRSYEHLDNFCHTAKECGEAGGTFEQGFGCPFKGDQPQGYCLSPEAEYELQNNLFGVSKISGLRNLIAVIFNGAIGVLIITSAVFFIWGAFKYLVSAVATSIERSKEIMVDSLVGLALGLGAFAILSNVNPNLLNLVQQKIYMINRVSFYNVVYCNDLVDKNAKLMYAGTPDAPLSYTAQLPKEGFNKTIEEAECGKEYFIEGADTLAVCMGNSCGGKGELCVNCVGGLGKDCKSSSAVEHSCSDCKFGGNVITSKAFKADQVWLFLFCNKRTSEGIEVIAETLANVEPKMIESSSAGAQGYVANFCIKDFKLSRSEVEDFFNDECASAIEEGMVLFVDAEMEFDGDAFDYMAVMQKRFENNPEQQALIGGLVGVGALAVAGGVTAPLAIVPFAAAAIIDAQSDNIYFPVNKNSCNTNLLNSTIGVNEGLVGSIFETEEMAFETLMTEKYSRVAPSSYINFSKQAWSKDEILKMLEEGVRSPCGFQVQ